MLGAILLPAVNGDPMNVSDAIAGRFSVRAFKPDPVPRALVAEMLALARGLDTCPQEYWARYPQTVAAHVGMPEDHMLFSGMALGYRDPDHPINCWRSTRDPQHVWCDLQGFE